MMTGEARERARGLLRHCIAKQIDLRKNKVWEKQIPPRCPPILCFGDSQAEKPLVATVGANPSRKEYLRQGTLDALAAYLRLVHEGTQYLEPPYSRLRLLSPSQSLEQVLHDEQLQDEILDGYDDYFRVNPYRWFGNNKDDSSNVEGFLRGFGASYFGVRTEFAAVHIDLFPFPTLEDFKKLEKEADKDIFKSDWARGCFQELVSVLQPDVLIVFGRNNVEHFGRRIDPALKILPKSEQMAVGEGSLGMPVVMLSTNLGNPYRSAAAVRGQGVEARSLLHQIKTGAAVPAPAAEPQPVDDEQVLRGTVQSNTKREPGSVNQLLRDARINPELGRCYSREEIHHMLGGEIQNYLPMSNGRIVAGCFKGDMNPLAPEFVYPGTGSRIEERARLIARSGHAIPIFMKRGNKSFEFVGHYRCTGISTSATDLRDAAQRSGRDDITSILRFEPCAAMP
jgi:GMP synthase-like glutamine amidotransferase